VAENHEGLSEFARRGKKQFDLIIAVAIKTKKALSPAV
jgi:hypothetical protein